jgi:hypothetical protein
MFPPSPESPARFTQNKEAFGTPRVGMLVSNHATDEDDDDVSVLTFHTLGTKDTGSSVLDSSNRFDDAKNNLCSGRDEGIKPSLSHISEESQLSVEGYKSTKRNDDTINDDESMSLAESVLDSTNKLLNSIGSASYYSGLNSKLSNKEKDVQETFSPPPKPNVKHPSPVKLGSMPQKSLACTMSISSNSNDKCRSPLLPEKSVLVEKKATKYSANDRTKHEPQSSYREFRYFDEESNENSNQTNLSSKDDNKKASTTKNGKLRRMQAETKQLQLLLREKQLETKLAMSELDASIKRANALLG